MDMIYTCIVARRFTQGQDGRPTPQTLDTREQRIESERQLECFLNDVKKLTSDARTIYSHDDRTVGQRMVTVQPLPTLVTVNTQGVTTEVPGFDDVPERRAGSEDQQQMCKVIMESLVERYPSNRMPLHFSGIDTVVGRSIRLTSKGSDGCIAGRRVGAAKLDQRATRTTKHSTSGPSLVGRVTRAYPPARLGLNRGMIHIQKAPIHQPYTPRLANR